MGREVRLGDLNEREKDSTILTLAGYSTKMRQFLEELAKKNGYVRRWLDDLGKECESRLGFLERVYLRAELPRQTEERVRERMDSRVWGRFGP
jgi:hypothetical protein